MKRLSIKPQSYCAFKWDFAFAILRLKAFLLTLACPDLDSRTP